MTSRVQNSPKFLDENYATWVEELLQVIGEIGEADPVPRISERYLSAQAIVAEGSLSEEGTAFGGQHEASAPSWPGARNWEGWLPRLLPSGQSAHHPPRGRCERL